MKIAVCDDIIEEQRDLQEKLLTVLQKRQEDFDCTCYDSGEALIQDLERGVSYDLLILDIYMKGMSGIETARKARACIRDVSIAFLTASADYAVEAFALKALHYLVKPVKEEDLAELMSRFGAWRTSLPEKKEILTLKKGDKTYCFLEESVIKIMSSKRGVDIYQNGEDAPFWIPVTFGEAEQQLEGRDFLRISRGFMISMGEIKIFRKNGGCELKDGTLVLVSRKNKEQTRKRYHDYLLRCLENGERSRI